MSAARSRGSALVVALVAVVAMTAAAFALFRSVDDGQGAVAQYPLARGARLAVDQGLADATQAWLGVDPDPALGVEAADRDQPAAAYWAALGEQTADGRPAVLAELPPPAWTPEGPAPTGWPGERVDPATQHLRRYAIERLCSTPGPAGPASCRLQDAAGTVCASAAACKAPDDGPAPWVRITVRVDGPRGTVAWGQAFARGR